MKLVHLSDLHLGKRVNEFSMIDDQKYILSKILGIVDNIKPDAVVIAGDIYDKSQPSSEAVKLFDDFLVGLARLKVQVFAISGNHDSPERIAFGGRLMDVSGIHMSPTYNGIVEPITMHDEYGDINIYMLPFIKPINVRRYFENEEIETYSDAMRVAIENMHVDNTKRNVLITHQFVTGATRCDSEEISIGGTNNVDASVFDDFDYVALGHIHGPQNIGSERIRYSGTPLKYSFSEIKHKKSVTVVDIHEKGNISIDTIPLEPLHDFIEIRGLYNNLVNRDYYSTLDREAYIHVILTDEEDVVDAIGRLRTVYPNLMRIDYDNARTRSNGVIDKADDVEMKTPMELFEEFYLKQNNVPMSEEQRSYMDKLISSIWEAER